MISDTIHDVESKLFYSLIRSWISQNYKTIVFTIGGIYVSVKAGKKLKEHLDNKKREKILKKWESAPKDVVILHTVPFGRTIPNPSPFGMKLETYLRMAKIPYKHDFESPWGPVGKTPWITLNGEHMGDSQAIIDKLGKMYNVKIGNYSAEEVAVGRAVRIMMDEYLYWGVGLWRYVYSEGKGLDEIFDLPPAGVKEFYKRTSKRVTGNAWAQGIGRHSKDQVIEMMKDVLRTASVLLGSKKFLLGELPSQEDCSFFGFLGAVLWSTPGSPYEKLMKEELPNLVSYCNRVKEIYWPDWDMCLAGSN